MHLIMLGTGPFAVPTLEALAASPHEIALVVTRPARGRDPQASPLQRAGELLGLAVWSPASVNLPESQARLTSLGANLLVVCDYGEILKSETLATTQLGGINLHGSLLPKFRGAAPVQTAILRGETETGNSVIQMTPGLDAGPCLGQQRTLIDPDEDAAALETRLAKMGAELVLRVVEQLASGTTQPIQQDAASASKAPRIRKEQGAIDWSRPAIEIHNLVRAFRPWPRAYTFWHRNDAPPMRLNIDRARAASAAREARVTPEERVERAERAEPGQPYRIGQDIEERILATSPGTVLQVDERLLVATGDGALDLLELQAAGKRSMSAGEFLRGNRVQLGDRLGPESLTTDR
jgi:methionyl-tRNA formyltransferase